MRRPSPVVGASYILPSDDAHKAGGLSALPAGFFFPARFPDMIKLSIRRIVALVCASTLAALGYLALSFAPLASLPAAPATPRGEIVGDNRKARRARAAIARGRR